MHNLVNKFTPQTDATTGDDGVVAIEYVLVAAVVAAGVLTLVFTGFWARLNAKLSNIILG